MASGVLCTAINAIIMMTIYPVYLYFLGYEQYGVWLILATVLSFAQLGNLGIGPAVTKLVAEEHAKNNSEGIQKYVVNGMAVLFFSGLIILIFIVFFKSQIISLFNLMDKGEKTALWLLPYIGLLSIYIFLVQIYNATLSGLGRADLANYALVTGRIFALIIASTMLYIGYGIESILVGSIMSNILIHIMSFIYIKKITKLKFILRSNFCYKYAKDILSFGGKFFSGSLINMLIFPFNKLIISRYIGVSSVPIFEIAFSGCMQIRAVFDSALRPTMPEISRISAERTQNGYEKIKSLNQKNIKLILKIGLPFYVLIFTFLPSLLELWLSSNYNASLCSSFRILLIGTFISVISVPSYYIIIGLGKVNYLLISALIQAITNVALIILFSLFISDLTVVAISAIFAFSMIPSSFYIIYIQKKILLPQLKLRSSVIDKMKPAAKH